MQGGPGLRSGLRSPRVDLRRALLLFAIVLGLAALVASVTRPSQDAEAERAERPSMPAAAAPRPEARPLTVSFSAGGVSTTRRVPVAGPATVLVEARVPGQAELLGLGLTAPVAPATPARFEVLADQPGRYPVIFTPAAGGVRTRPGTLVVTRPRGSARRRG